MSEPRKVYASDTRGVDSINLLRDRVAIDILPTVVELIANGKLALPRKRDGAVIGGDFGAALRAKSLADAIVNALSPRDEPATDAANAEEGAPLL